MTFQRFVRFVLPMILPGVWVTGVEAQNLVVDTCMPGPYFVQFERASVKPGPLMREILDNLVDNYPGCGEATVLIRGHVEKSESVDLALARAEVVSRYLIAHRIPRDRIYLQGMDASHPPTPSIQPDLTSALVEIQLDDPTITPVGGTTRP